MSLDPSFARAIVLKVAFHPEPLRRCQAAILYRALQGTEFTADEVLVGELIGDDTKISGISVGALVGLGLIQCVGRRKAASPSRNGCKTNVWVISKPSTALTWLSRNNFAPPSLHQPELPLSA
jgi:hypothetical protein